MTSAESAAASRPSPAWRDLFREDALRRLVRLSWLDEHDKVVWLGPPDDPGAKRDPK